MKKLLLQLDTAPMPSVFDRVVAHDGGADDVMSYGGVSPETVRDLVHGCIFTRGPKDLRNTAIFVGGTDMAAGERLFAAARKAFFGPMRVSAMLDSNGSNTTAVAAVAKVVQAAGGDVKGARAVVTAGTGPVGMRAAGLLAKAGADVTITSRRPADAAFLEGLQKRFGGSIRAVTMGNAAQASGALDGAELLISAGPAGVCMVPRAAWAGRSGLRVAADLNAVPPLGVEGIEVQDNAVERDGVVVFGALGVGGLKMKIHKACIARLFETNDALLDAESIAEVAQSLQPSKGRRGPRVTSVPRVLLAGVSMRAVAVSAIRAGFDVAVVDAFADLDLPAPAQAVALPASGERFDVPAAVRAARHVRADFAVYGSAFENCPRGVAALSRSRTLWGNTPDVLRRVRRPATLFETFAAEGFAVPPTRPPGDVAVSVDAGWLRKPLRSGGGRDIRPWTGRRIAADSYLQQHLAGVPGSIVFTAVNGTSHPVLVSRQIVGDRAFGATGYRYCGSIASRAGDLFGRDEVAATAASLARVATGVFGLVGVNGLDFVVGADTVWPLEVNPRWCASMELAERAGGPSVFAAHVAACTGARRVTATPFWPAAARAFGKAIVFARDAVVAGDTRPWLVQPDIADVPRPGVHIPAGGPICTVFAEAGDAAACYDALVHCAGRVYAAARRWHPPEADRLNPCASLCLKP